MDQDINPHPGDGPSDDEIGDGEFAAQRRRMVNEQLRRREIHDERVLSAMAKVPRHVFVPAKWRDAAYRDIALPIDCDQTISQPYTVAFMCEAAALRPNAKVLEVGTGSGYGAAVLGELAGQVHTVERIPQLADQAQAALAQLGYTNIHVHLDDGTLGLPDAAPFDAIVVTAGAKALPKPYLEQLVDGGRMVIPIGNHTGGQTMYQFTSKGHEFQVENLGGFAFVPLIGDHGQG